MGKTNSPLLTALRDRLYARCKTVQQNNDAFTFLVRVERMQSLSRWLVLGDVDTPTVGEMAALLAVDTNELKTHIAEIVREGYDRGA